MITPQVSRTGSTPSQPNGRSLTKPEVEEYQKEGYLVVPRLISRDDLRRIDETIRELTRKAMAAGDYSKILEVEPQPVNGEFVPRRIYNPFEQDEGFRALATDPRLLDRIESIIGPNITLHHSKLNMKPPRVGSAVEWHQDLSYFPHTNDDLVTVLIYLDDATEENGCLQVLPRHHHHFFNHNTADGYFAGMITENMIDGQFGSPVSLAAPAGSAIFMHCITPHSSLPNRSANGRRTLIFEYRAADAIPLYCGEQIGHYEKLTHLLRGEPAQFARFGGPRPYIPRFPHSNQSLYQLQEETKAKAAGQTSKIPTLA